MPNSLFQLQLRQELMTSRAGLRSCYGHAPILLREGLLGLKLLAGFNLAEETWEVATDPFGEQQTIASRPGTTQHPTQDPIPAPGTQAWIKPCPCSPVSWGTSGHLLESPPPN